MRLAIIFGYGFVSHLTNRAFSKSFAAQLLEPAYNKMVKNDDKIWKTNH